MRVCWFGIELDFTFELPAIRFYLGPTTVDDEPEPEPEPPTIRGDALSTPIGFRPTPHPGWERPLNHWDEPGEGDEDT